MNSIFIGGIPTAGKTFLATEIAKETSMRVVSSDFFKEEMLKDPKLEKWVNFYWNLDEKMYFSEISCDEKWQNLVSQSEAFWSTILSSLDRMKEPFILEGVNILPHLARKDLKISGIYMLGESEELVYERLLARSRWGDSKKLKSIEARYFFQCEQKKYKVEARKYGYKAFSNYKDAKKELLKMIDSNRDEILHK